MGTVIDILKSDPLLKPAEKRIFLTQSILTNTDQQTDQSLWSKNINLYFSDDFCNSKKILLQQGNKFIITKDFLYAAKLSPDSDNDVE